MKKTIFTALLFSAAIWISSCGSESKPPDGKDSTAQSSGGNTRGGDDFAAKNPYWKGDAPSTETGEGAALICNCMGDLLKEANVPLEAFMDKSLDELMKSEEARSHAPALMNTPKADACLQLTRKTYKDMGISDADILAEYSAHCRIPPLK